MAFEARITDSTNHPERDDSHNDGSKALENKYPRPSWLTAYPIHVDDGGGQQPAKGACQCSCTEENGCANAEFGSPIPAAQIVVYP